MEGKRTTVVAALLLTIALVWAGGQLGGLKDRVADLEEQVAQLGSVPAVSVGEEEQTFDRDALTIPVVYITADSLTDWEDKSDVRQAELTYTVGGVTEFTRAITIRPQGSSSMAYDKKNFTIVLQDGAVQLNESWGEQSKFCLKANYIDPTHAGNVVSAKLAGEMNRAYGVLDAAPNNGSVDGFPCWVVLNGEDAGLYCWNIPKEAWMFGMDKENPDHIVLCGETWSEASQFCTDTYTDEDWSVEVGPEDAATREKFLRLMDFIANTDDETFVADFDQYLDFDACLNYYCYMCVSSASDNEGKNMLMVTYDGQVWAPALYDLDSLWGIEWDGLGLCMDAPAYLPYSGNGLFARIRTCFEAELFARYAELRQGVLSEEHIWKTFEDYMAAIPAECYERDTAMWNADGRMIRTLDLMKLCVAEYLPWVDAAMEYTPE